MRLGRTADATIYGRQIAAAATAALALLLLLAPGAAADAPVGAPPPPPESTAFVPKALHDAASANPPQVFRVIVQGQPTTPAATVKAAIYNLIASSPAPGDAVAGAYASIRAVAAELSGTQILLLSEDPVIFAITPDMPLRASVAGPPVALEPPTITGTAETGASLSTSPGQWSDLQVNYAYQWQRCDAAAAVCADVAGASSSTYTVAAADLGSTLVAAVTATNADGSATSRSTATAVVVASAPPPPPPPLGPPTAVVTPGIVGSASVGTTLSADDGLWSGGAINLTRQWQRCSATGDACLDVGGAIGPTYLVGADDVGSTLRVVVSATDANGTTPAASAATGVVAAPAPPPTPPAPPPSSVTVPSVTGTATAGETLTAADGTWSGLAQLTRRWQRCSAGACLDVAGATGATYVLGADDVGFSLRVVVTATDGGGSTSAASAVSEVVAAAAPPPAPVPPSNVVLPSITGTATAGETLIADDGSWSGPVLQLVRRWQRCLPAGDGCTDIGGADRATYVLGSGDVGATIRVLVTATDAGGGTSASSNVTNVVAAAPTGSSGSGSGGTPKTPDPPPVNRTPPTADGTPVTRSSLVATPGTWTGDDPFRFAYRWERCDAAGGGTCVPVGTTQTYAPVDADVGSTLQVVVTATDHDDRTTSVTSAATDRVAPYSASGFFSWQLGPYAAKVDVQWDAVAAADARPPAIAVVDSGVDATLPGLAGSVVQQVSLTSLPQRTAADGYGHGSFVAQVAAGHGKGEAGAAPKAPIVSLDVMNDDGMALTSDVVAAADWIYTHKDENNIRVANFSLIGSTPSSIMFDPLDRALERLWLSGVVVVTAAGNFAVNGAESNIPYSPANDPFAITVGASDPEGTRAASDDIAAPWSAWGHTLDGFAKPELGAPGRYVVASVPTDSTLYTARADRIVGPGKLQLSGTSFAAPLVSGVAANLIALHPSWTPDHVKGALMLTAAQPGAAPSFALGVGEVDAAAALAVTDPPNPNAAVEQFVVADPNGGTTPVFDAASWGTTAQANASWGTASWGTASWGTASWGTASWGTDYWSSASWGTASWGTASWGTASWGTASWGTASWGTASWGTDNANADVLPAGAYWMNWTTP